jgi:hypothetical protein
MADDAVSLGRLLISEYMVEITPIIGHAQVNYL